VRGGCGRGTVAATRALRARARFVVVAALLIVAGLCVSARGGVIMPSSTSGAAAAPRARGESALAGHAPAGAGVLKGAQLEDCLNLLGAPSDEEKFAGLLLVTKAVRPDDVQAMRRVLGAVGMKFLYRLMSSAGSPGGASDAALVYQCMALNVLSSFCSMQELWPEIHGLADFIRMAPLLLKAADCSVAMHPAVDSVLSCLACMVTSPEGARALCKHKGPAVMADFMQHQRDEEPERKQQAVFVLGSLLTPAENPGATAEAVPKLVQALMEGRGMIRLDLLPLVARTLRSQEPDFITKLHALGAAWHGTMRSALMNLLQHKLPTQHRKHILAVALSMCEHFGQTWAIPPIAAGATSADGTFVHLIVGFSNIELRMRLEEAVKPEDNAEVVPTALALVEKTLQYLSEDGDEEEEGGGAATKTRALRRWVDMDVDRLLKMKRDLDESVDAIFIYLQDLQETGKCSDELVAPMCRLLGLWFLEVDSDDSTTKLCASLPVICDSTRAHVSSCPALGRHSPLYFMLPALTHLVASDDVRHAYLRAKGHEVVACMMKAALEGRSRQRVGDDDDEGGSTDLCMSGAVLLSRIMALSPKAASSSPGVFRELVGLLLPMAGAMSQVTQRCDADTETCEAMGQHVASILTLAFQVLQAADAGSFDPGRDASSLRGYLEIFKQTLRHWVGWDAGALCLLAAGGAAAVHAEVRNEMRSSGVEACLAACRTDSSTAKTNDEAVGSLMAVLSSEESSAAHEQARARAAAEGTQESEKEAAKREAKLRAATERPEAPPYVDPKAAWAMRANRAAREIADLEEAAGEELDFGGQLRLNEIVKKLPGTSMVTSTVGEITSDGVEGLDALD